MLSDTASSLVENRGALQGICPVSCHRVSWAPLQVAASAVYGKAAAPTDPEHPTTRSPLFHRVTALTTLKLALSVCVCPCASSPNRL